MLKHTTNKTPIYQQHTNFEYLIDGYCRENDLSSKYIPSPITDIVLKLTDKMNGYTFRWNISLDGTLDQILESAPFDLELSNKFFLRATKNTYNTSTTISLISFPFPSRFGIIMFHCQFYCDEIDEIYSKIQTINLVHNNSTYNTNSSPFQMNHINWKIFHGPTIKHLTIECKLNILRISSPKPSSSAYYPHVHRTQSKNTTVLYNNEIINYNREIMRFSWNIQQKELISKINASNDIQIVSNVYHNLFQFVIWNNHSKQAHFGIRIVSLPQGTHKMGVKLEIAMEHTTNNKQKIIWSKIVSFSYEQFLQRLPNENERILSKQLLKKKKLKIFCKTEIVARYAKDNIYISDKKSISKVNKPQQTLQMFTFDAETKTEMEDSKSKILEHSASESFIWHINDPGIIQKINIKQTNNSVVNSAVFELCQYQWYASIEHAQNNYYSPTRVTDHNKKIRISLWSLGLTPTESIDCKVSMWLLQTGARAEYYQNFCSQFSTLQHKNAFLECDSVSLSLLHEMSIKIEIFVVNCKTNYMVSVKELKSKHDKNKQLNEDVKSWLCDTVGLKEYCDLFAYHGIDNLKILQSLTKDDIYRMGIDKVGHQAILMHQIQLLSNSRKRQFEETNDSNNSPTKRAKTTLELTTAY
eukprot:261702_1